MEHAKKLMLIEPKLLKQSMRDRTLSRLDEEIHQTLDSDLSDNEKAVKYIAALKKYKYYESPPEKAIQKEKEEKESVESDVLESVPSTNKYKAKQLLDRLKEDPDVRINREGEFIYRQRKIPKSRVVDLINDVILKKSTESPPGWEEFSDSLKAVNAPRKLVANDTYWKRNHSPSPAPKSRRKRGRKSWEEY